MKKLISMFVILVMVGALCVGCQKTETSEPGVTEKPKKEGNNAGADWQPEESKQPTTKPADSDHDHSDPNHRH
ncbi:MAG: hypothetical protein GY794_19825 [bacterium]|nr:hypothetical protein [bacterium]